MPQQKVQEEYLKTKIQEIFKLYANEKKNEVDVKFLSYLEKYPILCVFLVTSPQKSKSKKLF